MSVIHFVIPTSQVADGMQQVMKKIINVFANDRHSFLNGIFIPVLGSVLSASIHLLIADEGAIKHMLGHKGASGSKPCILCRNCVPERLILST